MSHVKVSEKTQQVTPRREGGYIIAMTALLLVPMMLFAAFAVDVGSWYAEADQAQRAADAGALAGVVFMPEFQTAVDAAKATVARNGYIDPSVAAVTGETSNAVVTVTRSGENGLRVQVDTRGDSYFGGAVTNGGIDIKRYARAEYILPIPIGNPTNQLGSGNLGTIGGTQERLWLAVNSICHRRTQGDKFSARYMNRFHPTQFWGDYCPGTYQHFQALREPWNRLHWSVDDTSINNQFIQYGQVTRSVTAADRTANPEYRQSGYHVIFTLPGVTGAPHPDYNIQLYDPGICSPHDEMPNFIDLTRPSSYVPPGGGTAQTLTGALLETSLYVPGPSLLEDNFTTEFGGESTQSYAENDCGWVNAYTINGSQPRGRWVMNYRSRDRANELGINYFGVRIVQNPASPVICSTLSTSTCPSVSAYQDFPIYITRYDKAGNEIIPGATTDAFGNTIPAPAAEFFLANVDDVDYGGKTMEITLYDPGEGMANMQILLPDGSEAPTFNWRTVDRALNNQIPATQADVPGPIGNANCGGLRCLNIQQDQFGGASTDFFNNRTVILTFTVPANSCTTTALGSRNCWWKIRYQPQSNQNARSVTDRTTWSVAVVGDPVRLVE